MTSGDGITIYTIGHSTRTRAELVELLDHYGIEILLDIRKIPYSRYNPQFNREGMMRSMPETGIRYEHCDELGGIRPPQEVVERAKSCSERSRGYATYMQTPAFARGLARALALAATHRIALLCAEADPTHCHRFWVADVIVARGRTVRHIVTRDRLDDHPENLFTYFTDC